MPAARRDRGVGPYEAEVVRRVAERAPLGFAVFLLCLVLNTIFESLHFPERRVWMATFAAGFLLLVAVASALVRRRPAWSVYVLVAFVNLVGVALNVYHLLVGASVAMGLWSLTGLLTASAVILPWGSRSQALACVGTLLSYPLQLAAGTDALTWGAGGTYLFLVGSLGVFAASLFARSLRSDLQLMAALSEREARLQSYFDLSLVGAAILSPDGRCGEVNDELCRMFGYSRPELLRLSWLEVVDAEESAIAAAVLARALSPTGTPQARDMRCARKDGETLDAMVSVRGLPGPEGAIDHVMVLVQDITERKRAEAERERYLAQAETARRQAEEASRAKDVFLATVSHELRTPLTPILAWSRLLREGRLGAEKTTAGLAAVERSARAQARLIDDLLDVSRLAARDWRVALRPMELAPVVRTAVEVVRPAADAKGVALETALPPLAVPVQGDPERLQQVVWNLVSNAVKFTPRGGRVRIALERADDRARLTVRDTGEGISPDFLPYVFERFRQADSSGTRRHGGLGLGLAIVRGLVERHGGNVRAESAGTEQGAVFTVELPLLASVAEEAARVQPGRQVTTAEPDAAPGLPLGGLRVLVVDDDPDSNAVVSALLGSCGAEVRTAVSAPEALEVAGRWQPDVVVSDIAMPGEDGCTLLREIRSRGGPLGRVPAVALTAHAGMDDRRRVLAAGFQAHVVKPFDPAQLAAAVENAAHAGPEPPA